MVDELTRSRVTLHQTLHGYSEGHRLIGGSVKLAQPEARAMLILSDASGSGVKIPPEGYLTGYPLAGSGKYVLARTWSAPEMNRPGCVWTHSLLIDFADLARVSDSGDLTRLFVRPATMSPSTYGQAISVAISIHPVEVGRGDTDRIQPWIEAIYGSPQSKVVAHRQGSVDDDLVLALWMQQWPRLRRSFRFCSLAVEDRSTGADIFDFQLIDGARPNPRSRLSDAVLANTAGAGKGIEPLVEDLQSPNVAGLRDFLRDVGGDITNGRAAMLPLTHLFVALDPHSEPQRITLAVEALAQLGASQGKMGRAAAAKLIFARLDDVDPSLFRFALDQVRLDERLMDIRPEIIGAALLKWDPEAFGTALRDDGPLRKAADAALPTIDGGQLVSALSTYPEALFKVVAARPEILANPDIWKESQFDVAALFAKLALSREQIDDLVVAMMRANRHDGASLVAHQFGVGPILHGLGVCVGDAGKEDLGPWSRAVAERAGDLAVCLAASAIRDRRVAMLLLPYLDPDAVPNNIGEDPWFTAIGSTKPTTDAAGEDFLAAFLFCRAMSWRTNAPGRLLYLSVQRVHEAVATNRISQDSWKLAERHLPWVAPWREWDRCERIRRAVVDRFLDKDLPPQQFGTVVNDGPLWTRLVDIMAASSRGRRYLDRVRKSLRDGPEEWWRERERVIEKKLR